MSRWEFYLGQLRSRLWMRSAVFCLLGLGSAMASLVFRDYLPASLTYKIGADAVDSILNILASSMLAATTFSLSVMVSAYSAAANSATPRATKLLLRDSTAQTALATFIGAFLYSLVGIIALKAGIYGDNGRVLLFIVTIAVIILIIVTLLRWIEYLARLGRVGETIDTVEKAASAAIKAYVRAPLMGGKPYLSQVALHAGTEMTHPDIGYLQYVDMGALEKIGTECDAPIFLSLRPGHFNDSCRVIATSPVTLDDRMVARIRDCFIIRGDRSFEQDPRYGLIVLSEIASRALSPAVNDPGTAIDVIGTHLRVMAPLAAEPEPADVDFPHVHVPDIDLADMFDDFFKPVARDGAGVLEVGIRLQKSLAALSRMGHARLAPHAQRMSAYALMHAAEKLDVPADLETLSGFSPKKHAKD